MSSVTLAPTCRRATGAVVPMPTLPLDENVAVLPIDADVELIVVFTVVLPTLRLPVLPKAIDVELIETLTVELPVAIDALSIAVFVVELLTLIDEELATALTDVVPMKTADVLIVTLAPTTIEVVALAVAVLTDVALTALATTVVALAMNDPLTTSVFFTLKLASSAISVPYPLRV